MRMIFGLILTIGFSFGQTDDIGFSYGILGRLQSDDEQITVLQDSSMIQTGDSVRINVGYRKETNLYVLYQGSQGEYMLLYPEESGRIEDVSDLPDTLYNTVLHWSQFSDPAGFETFYLINSKFVLTDFHKLIKKYDKVGGKGKMKVAKLIQTELDKLNPNNKQDFASIGTRLDKPIVGGVAFRGEGDELKDLSLTDVCTGKYGIAFKKIILDHK